jgi:hypothetical protein
MAKAQMGFKKDSLQIKVYVSVYYDNDIPQKIEILKVFCDYCSVEQLKYLKLEAWKATYKNRFSYNHKIKNGEARLAHYIRVRKKYFKKLQ